MSEGGAALMAVGVASGEERARVAAEQSISSHLLEVTIDGARGILFNITGGPGMTLFEVNQAAAIIREKAHPDANMIFGAVVDENMGDDLRITVIATGFEQNPTRRQLIAQVGRQEQLARPVTNNPEPARVKKDKRAPEPEMAMVDKPSGQPQREKVEAPAPKPAANEPPRFSPNNLDIPAFLRRR
jgi:cell division protein FtsZ